MDWLVVQWTAVPTPDCPRVLGWSEMQVRLWLAASQWYRHRVMASWAGRPTSCWSVWTASGTLLRSSAHLRWLLMESLCLLAVEHLHLLLLPLHMVPIPLDLLLVASSQLHVLLTQVSILLVIGVLAVSISRRTIWRLYLGPQDVFEHYWLHVFVISTRLHYFVQYTYTNLWKRDEKINCCFFRHQRRNQWDVSWQWWQWKCSSQLWYKILM